MSLAQRLPSVPGCCCRTAAAARPGPRPGPAPCPRPSTQRRVAAAAAKQAEPEVPDVTYNWVAQQQGLLRALPLYTGAIGISGILLNRILAGVAPVVDASSSQSRTDVLGIFMSAVLLLTGLQWLSLKPREMPAEPLSGSEVLWVDKEVAKKAPELAEELTWTWESLKSCTRTKSLVVIYQGRNIFHGGFIAEGLRPGTAKAGDVCAQAMQSGQGNYLANLLLYPGRPEFMKYLPEETQGVVVQPIGSSGVLIAGTDTIRGISRLDQAWMASLADKLEVSLEKVQGKVSGAAAKGFGTN